MASLGTGLLQGYTEAAGAERQRVREDQAKRDELELRTLSMLAQSPDHEIASRAVAGLLDFSQPRKKKGGLGGFLGETEGHPALPSIQQLLRAGTPAITQTDPGHIAQMPLSQREPQMSLPQPGQAGAPPVDTSGRLPTLGQTTVPRRVFSTGPYEDRVRGVIEGVESQGVSLRPEEKKQIALEISGYSGGRTGAGAASTVGEGNILPDPASPTGFSQVLYDRHTGREASRIPAMDPTKARVGAPGAGLSLVVNPIDGSVSVVNKAAAYAGDPGAAKVVGAPGAGAAPPTGPGMSPGAPQAIAPGPPGGPKQFVQDHEGVWVVEGTLSNGQLDLREASPAEVQAFYAQKGAPSGAGGAPGAAAGPPAAPRGLNVGSISERTQAREDATQLTPAERRAYGNPNLVTKGDARRAGLVPMSEAEIVASHEVDNAITAMDQIEALVHKVYSSGWASRAAALPLIGSGVERLVQEGALTEQMNTPEYANLRAEIERAIPGAARLSGNRGNLSEQERENARTSFPNLGEGITNVPDTYQTAIAKVQHLKQRLQMLRQEYQGGAVRGGGMPPPAPPQ